jgi:hypothetical protein
VLNGVISTTVTSVCWADVAGWKSCRTVGQARTLRITAGLEQGEEIKRTTPPFYEDLTFWFQRDLKTSFQV